ncbi:hypothetical protein PMI04_010045 [Sphingobium sp. AP49]|uniref:hypothetical protein n=1 Tax=Sphingobium sp. AP49 TaxID=1144307 RepID=UPI00026EE74E|nr:hypothetical protein [Sphingobium sp. AP49]WHO40898.1 hypothetical protein PMI04_010045 [Sphingobium sp. AP49]
MMGTTQAPQSDAPITAADIEAWARVERALAGKRQFGIGFSAAMHRRQADIAGVRDLACPTYEEAVAHDRADRISVAG